MKKAVLREYLKNREKGWTVTQEADGKVHVRPTENGEIIDTPVVKVVKARKPKKGE